MAQQNGQARKRPAGRWRLAGWGLAVLLLLTPLLAMQLSDEVAWSAGDFLLFGVMLAVAGGMIELAARSKGNGFYRAGAGFAVVACFLLVVVNLAVGFLGSEDNDANLIFAGVIAIAVGSSFLARFRPAGMVKAMLAAAVAQALAGAIGLFAGWASPGSDGIYEVVMGTSLFGGLWLSSAGLFGLAARPPAGLTPSQPE